MKHSDLVFEVVMNAKDFAAQVISNFEAALQRFNELQAQNEELRVVNVISSASSSALSFSFVSLVMISEIIAILTQLVNQALRDQNSFVISVSQNVVSVSARLFEKLFDVAEYDEDREKLDA